MHSAFPQLSHPVCRKMSNMNPLCSHCVSVGTLGKVLPADWKHAELVLHGGRNYFQICSGNGALSHILHHIIPVWMRGRKKEVARKDRGNRLGFYTPAYKGNYLQLPFLHVQISKRCIAALETVCERKTGTNIGKKSMHILLIKRELWSSHPHRWKDVLKVHYARSYDVEGKFNHCNTVILAYFYIYCTVYGQSPKQSVPPASSRSAIYVQKWEQYAFP